MEKNQQQLGRGYITAACKAVGVSTALYRKAKRKKKDGEPLTRGELAVLVEYKRLIEEAQEQLKSL